jgi:hypothetical protein
MRRAGVLTIVLAWLLSAAPAGAKVRIVGDDTLPLVSGNVTPLATLPVGKPVGVRFRDHFMFVTGTEGLTVYDIADPALPVPVGALPLPHFENEDVDIGGNILLITNDPSETVGILYVIDISDPTLPTLKGVMANGVGDGQVDDALAIFGLPAADTPAGTGIGHTASCVNKDCTYAYLAGTSKGIQIVDLRDPANPTPVKRFVPAITGLATHDVQVDDTGLAWIVGADGTAAYDVTNPLEPKLVARTDESIKNSGQLGVPKPPDDPIFHFGDVIGGDGANPIDLIHHDSLRLGTVAHAGDAVGTHFAPTGGPGFDTKAFAQQAGKAYPAGGDSPVFGIVEEDYTRPSCEGAGSFQTWGMTDQTTSTGAQKLGLLGMYATELQKLTTNQSGWAPVTGLCSAHYFDYRDGIVAGGWYEEGTRFLDVRNPRHIRQVGYWVPTKGETWSVAYAPTDKTGSIVYALDYARGIDVLQLDRSDLRPREAPVRRSWLANTKAGRRLTRTRSTSPGRFGWVCRV